VNYAEEKGIYVNTFSRTGSANLMVLFSTGDLECKSRGGLKNFLGMHRRHKRGKNLGGKANRGRGIFLGEGAKVGTEIH